MNNLGIFSGVTWDKSNSLDYIFADLAVNIRPLTLEQV